MSLQEWAWIAAITTSIANVIFLAISASAAVYLYRWNIRNIKIESTRRMTEDLRHYNELVLRNEELQELEVTNHGWGNISKSEVVRMYEFFILLNGAVSTYEANKLNAIDSATYESQMNNYANTTYKDREFIKQHVLPRGYSNGFRDNFVRRWDIIDKTGMLPSV